MTDLEVTLLQAPGGHTFRFAHPEGAFRVEVFYTAACATDPDAAAMYASVITELPELLIQAGRDVLGGRYVRADIAEGEPLDPSEEAAVQAARERLAE